MFHCRPKVRIPAKKDKNTLKNKVNMYDIQLN